MLEFRVFNMAPRIGSAPTSRRVTTGCFTVKLPGNCQTRFIPHSALKMVGSGGNAPLVVFPDLFCDGRFTVGCGEHRPKKIRMTNDEIRNKSEAPRFGFRTSFVIRIFLIGCRGWFCANATWVRARHAAATSRG